MAEKIEIQGVIFDMDGLIFDTERLVKLSWSSASKILGLPDVGEHIYYTLGTNRKSRNIYFKEHFGEDFPIEEFTTLVHSEFNKIVKERGIALKTGFLDLATTLKDRQIKMALATSSSELYATKLLKDKNIYSYFTAFAFGDGVKNSKPNPEIYLKATNLLAIETNKLIALEDAPIGVEAAVNAKLKTIMIPDLVQPDQRTKEKCFKIFPSLLEVNEYIKSAN